MKTFLSEVGIKNSFHRNLNLILYFSLLIIIVFFQITSFQTKFVCSSLQFYTNWKKLTTLAANCYTFFRGLFTT